MENVCLPELKFLLSDEATQPYLYTKTFEEAEHDPCFIVHTSGSTGMPKPVTWTHSSLSAMDKHHLVPPLLGHLSLWGSTLDSRNRNYCGWPLFNGAGLGAGIMDTCFNDTTVVMGPAQPVTPDIVSAVLDYADVDAASCLASTLEEIAKRPDILTKLRKLRFITYVGGPDALFHI